MKEGWTKSWAPTTQGGKTISRGESSGKDQEEAVAALPQGGKQLGKEHHPCGAELAAIPLDSAMPDVTPSSMALEGKQWTDIAVNA